MAYYPRIVIAMSNIFSSALTKLTWPSGLIWFFIILTAGAQCPAAEYYSQTGRPVAEFGDTVNVAIGESYETILSTGQCLDGGSQYSIVTPPQFGTLDLSLGPFSPQNCAGTVTFAFANYKWTVPTSSVTDSFSVLVTENYPASIAGPARSDTYLTTATIILNPPQSGWWWNPSESGAGYTLELSQTDGTIFFGAYLYSPSGEAIWYVSTLSAAGSNVYSGPLVQYQGSQTLNGPYYTPTSSTNVGNVELTFTSTTTAALSITGAGLNPTNVDIQRYAFTANGLSSPPSATQPETGWWTTGQSGPGYFLEIQDNTMFFAANAYDVSGNPVWYVAQNIPTASTPYPGTLMQYGDGQILGGMNQPATLINSDVGTISIDFTSPSTGTLTLPDGVQIPIQKSLF